MEPDRATRRRARRRAARQARQARATGMLDGIVSQLGPGDVALDCGANVGSITGRLAATGATVLAFEPDPVAFARLTAAHGHAPNVHLHPAAVGVAPGTATLHRGPGFARDPVAATVGSTIVGGVRPAEAGQGHAVEVPVLDLPAIVADLAAGRAPPSLARPIRPGRLALLKLDVEGAEIAILDALHRAGLLARIGATLVETHERKFPARRPDFARIRERLGAAYPASRVFLDWV